MNAEHACLELPKRGILVLESRADGTLGRSTTAESQATRWTRAIIDPTYMN